MRNNKVYFFGQVQESEKKKKWDAIHRELHP